MSPSPDDVAHAYVERINAGELEPLLALFAPDAVLRHPTGTFTGLGEIGAMYASTALASGTQLTFERCVAAPGVVMLEVTAGNAPGRDGASTRAVDVFDLDADGRITTLTVYYL